MYDSSTRPSGSSSATTMTSSVDEKASVREDSRPSTHQTDVEKHAHLDEDETSSVGVPAKDDVEAAAAVVPASVPTETPDPNLVVFDGPNDPGNPKNWSLSKKIVVSSMMAWMTFVTTFSSSIFSVAIDSVAEEFHIGSVVATLGVSLFLLVRCS